MERLRRGVLDLTRLSCRLMGVKMLLGMSKKVMLLVYDCSYKDYDSCQGIHVTATRLVFGKALTIKHC